MDSFYAETPGVDFYQSPFSNLAINDRARLERTKEERKRSKKLAERVYQNTVVNGAPFPYNRPAPLLEDIRERHHNVRSAIEELEREKRINNLRTVLDLPPYFKDKHELVNFLFRNKRAMNDLIHVSDAERHMRREMDRSEITAFGYALRGLRGFSGDAMRVLDESHSNTTSMVPPDITFEIRRQMSLDLPAGTQEEEMLREQIWRYFESQGVPQTSKVWRMAHGVPI